MRTLQEIEICPKTMLTAADIAPFLKCDPYNINVQAHEDPSMLGFPVIVIGTRVKIPREGFVNFCRYHRIGVQPAETGYSGEPEDAAVAGETDV